MKKITLFCLLSIASYQSIAYAANPPIISNFWVSTNLQKNECLAKASEAVKTVGFTKRFSSTNNDVFGVTPDMKYTGQILCITEKGVAVFNVAGEIWGKSHSYTKQLHKEFIK